MFFFLDSFSVGRCITTQITLVAAGCWQVGNQGKGKTSHIYIENQPNFKKR